MERYQLKVGEDIQPSFMMRKSDERNQKSRWFLHTFKGSMICRIHFQQWRRQQQIGPAWQYLAAISGQEDFEQNQSRSKCFQFQLVTCWFLFVLSICKDKFHRFS